ncbi:MAG: hypothetical protein PWR04_623 [Anaerophaga sp.]|nr:hypothetical protein [Anaerophaga sp.]
MHKVARTVPRDVSHPVAQYRPSTFVLKFNVPFINLYGIFTYICTNTYTYETSMAKIALIDYQIFRYKI